jgi:hypothetical protein
MRVVLIKGAKIFKKRRNPELSTLIDTLISNVIPIILTSKNTFINHFLLFEALPLETDQPPLAFCPCQ